MPWLPFSPRAPGVAVKYFRLDPRRGEAVALLRAAAGARLPRQRHTGAVVAYTLAGRWRLAEADWIAGPGSVVLLPAAAVHTACVLEGSDEALVFAVARGERLTLGPGDAPLAIHDCRSELRRYLAWCERAQVLPRDLTK